MNLTAQNSFTNYASLGDLVVTQLVSAPFPHPQRAAGHTYKDKLYPEEKHYQDNRVAIFMPKNFLETGPINFVVHFHGWRGVIEQVLPQFQLVEQFVESGRNAILVVPQGPHDAPDSFGGKLEDPDGFKRFMAEVVQVLRQKGKIKTGEIENIILSGHSGGYHVISAILDRGGLTDKIKEVYLFDALYGQTPKFVAWLDKHQGKLIDIYTQDGGTKKETEALIADLKVRNVPHLAGKENEIAADELSRHRIIFLLTDLTHNQVVYQNHNFREYLKASLLPAALPAAR